MLSNFKIRKINFENLVIFLSIFIFTLLIIQNITSKNINDFYDPARDSVSYLSLAESLKNYNQFVRTEFIDTGVETIRTPIYPLFLSIFLNNLKTVIIIQNVFHIISSLILLSIIKKFVNFKFALIIFIIFLFNPVLISLNQLLITESFSIFLISLSVYFLLQNKNKYIFFFIVGFLPLLRPAFVVLSLGILLFINLYEEKLSFKKFLIICFLLLIPTVGWTVRNYNFTNLYLFSSLSGMNLLEETASGVMAIDEDLSENKSFFDIINIEYEERRYWSQVLRNEVELGNVSRVIANAPGPNPHLVANEYQSYAIRVLKDNIPELFILTSRSFIYILLEPGDHLLNYVFNLENLTAYKLIYTATNLFLLFFTFKYILKETFIKKKLDKIIIYYLLLIFPLLLLSTPHARFGSILIFFHLYFFSKEFNNFKNRRKNKS